MGLCIYIQHELAERVGGKRRKGTNKRQAKWGQSIRVFLIDDMIEIF